MVCSSMGALCVASAMNTNIIQFQLFRRREKRSLGHATSYLVIMQPLVKLGYDTIHRVHVDNLICLVIIITSTF